MLTGSLEDSFGVWMTVGFDRSMDVGFGEEVMLMEIMEKHGVGVR